MAANDGPVPVRTLAHAARLMREARQLGQYGIEVSEPVLDYPRLLVRVREVVDDVCTNSSLRQQIDSLGVAVHEHAGVARFVDKHTIESDGGLRLEAEKIIVCAGGVSRRLSVPGFELTHTHSDAWGLTFVPPSMLVIGAGATGVQVASIFNAFGSRIQLFQTGPRILPSEDEDVSAAVAAAFRETGIVVHENIGAIQSFEKTPAGVRMIFSKNGDCGSAEATLAVVAVGWAANSAGLSLAKAGVDASCLRRWRRYRPSHAGSASDTGGLRGGYQCSARPDDDDGGPSESDRQLHGPGVCPGGPYGSVGPPNIRCRNRGSALRLHHAYDH
jgi:pyruvate/2-oxoglutarate dehydrogenase complex dihydrolipoamide dehydrogenase (E3) component